MRSHIYRLYILDGNGHIQVRHDLGQLDDDCAALMIASKIASRLPYEVWDGARLVKRVARPAASGFIPPGLG